MPSPRGGPAQAALRRAASALAIVAPAMLLTVAAEAAAQAAAPEEPAPPTAGEAAPQAEPAVNEPAVTEPAVTEPAVTEPAVTEPAEPAEAEREDNQPPLIEDVAVAASSPTTPPMITAVITDDWSGVEQASVVFRVSDAGEWQRAPLNAGNAGLFVARLPDGVQRSGFQYYVEVFDAAKNGPALMGTAEEPYRVEPSEKGTLERMEEARDREELGPVHPAWMVLSLGTGVLAAAGSGVFWIDLAMLQSRHSAETNTANRAELERAMLGDGIIGGVLGAVAAAGLATGVSLLVYSALQE